MRISRLDLDGRGSGSPEGLVALILKTEPLSAPVPIEELAHALDIQEIAELSTEGFAGALLTDQYRSKGSILVSKGVSADSGALGRRRFTIGHELGHFLIPTHKPVKGDHFLCSREDMRTWSAKEHDTYSRMEVEANRFAALILMPPPLLRPYMARLGDPSLNGVLAVHEHFKVSKDAAARAYAQYHPEPVAIVVVKDGKVLRTYRGQKFPRVGANPGDLIPHSCVYHRLAAPQRELSELVEASAAQWLESKLGVRSPEMFEQALIQKSGYGLILLWAELGDEEDEDAEENMTAKQRLTSRRARA